MMTRIVKMEFKNEEIGSFKQLFSSNKEKIRAQPGCHGLKLLEEQSDSGTFFTYSLWESEDHLNAYRNSDLFAQVWKNTRALFADKAKAWSCNEIASL